MLIKPGSLGLVVALTLGGISAQEEQGFKLEPLHATGMMETGMMVNFLPNLNGPTAVNCHGCAEGPATGSEFIDHNAVFLLQEARLSENIRVFLGVGGFYFYVLPSKGNPYSVGELSGFALTDAHGEFDFWKRDGKDHGLSLKVGVFPFKYNEDAKNLGEYMFRTYTYPTIIYTGGLILVNSAGAQLSGLDANTRYGGFMNDLLLTDKTNQIPTGSLSLTDIVSYNYKNVLTIGAGFMLDNFYNPNGVANGISDTIGPSQDPMEYYYVLKNGTKVSAASTNPPAPDSIVDTLHYGFFGEKLMVKASLDLGNLLLIPSLSTRDLRLYFEAVLMGVNNRGPLYRNMKNRIAYMYGLNLPTFHVLDLLSVEFEYCRNPYADNTVNVTTHYAPVPDDPNIEQYGNSDNVKWTLYARKNISRNFSISGQVANDHTRLVDYFGKTNDASVLERPKNWYWALQFSYSI